MKKKGAVIINVVVGILRFLVFGCGDVDISGLDKISRWEAGVESLIEVS